MSKENGVVVYDVKMPFTSMVVFMVKWALASIPAILIIMIITSILMTVFGGFFGNF